MSDRPLSEPGDEWLDMHKASQPVPMDQLTALIQVQEAAEYWLVQQESPRGSALDSIHDRDEARAELKRAVHFARHIHGITGEMAA